MQGKPVETRSRQGNQSKGNEEIASMTIRRYACCLQKQKKEKRRMSENTKNMTDSQKLDLILAELADLRQWRTSLDEWRANVEERLKDTRPIWQAIHAQTERNTELLQFIDERLTVVEKELRSIDRRFETFSIDHMHMRMRGDIREFNARLTEIESRPN
jgi:hypothetical protein